MNRIGEFQNIPEVKLGIIAVSRDCFPRTLSETRRANIVKASGVYECPVTVENEGDMLMSKRPPAMRLSSFLAISARRRRRP